MILGIDLTTSNTMAAAYKDGEVVVVKSKVDSHINPSFVSVDEVGMLLKSVKNKAEDYFGEEITEAVISVPASFNNIQRKAIMQAGKQAGFEIKRIVNAPTAATIAYGINNTEIEKNIIITINLGGGSLI